MIECTAYDVCAATESTLVCGTGEETLSGVAIDSRRASASAACSLRSRARTSMETTTSPTPSRPVRASSPSRARSHQMSRPPRLRRAVRFLVRAADDDGTEFMLRLAEWWRAQQDWCVVGASGSVGTTTTTGDARRRPRCQVRGPCHRRQLQQPDWRAHHAARGSHLGDARC